MWVWFNPYSFSNCFLARKGWFSSVSPQAKSIWIELWCEVATLSQWSSNSTDYKNRQNDCIIFCSYCLTFEMLVTVDARIPVTKFHTAISIHHGRLSNSIITMSEYQYAFVDPSIVAKLIDFNIACRQITWISNLLHEVNIMLSQPATLYRYNISTIKNLSNNVLYIANSFYIIR